MPRATTELFELLAGDPLLCVQRRSVSNPAPHIPPESPRAVADAASDADSVAVDADLARVIQAWPSLPRNIRAAIVALVRDETGRNDSGDQACPK